MLILAAATLAIGLLLLILGLRGRRINDHPLCRKCGFDLIGLPTNPEPERAARARPTDSPTSPPRCPECGADTSTPRAVRSGARRRIRPAIAVGLLLTLAGLGVGGALGWTKASAFNWNTIKPEWWLRSDARGTGSAAASALDELARRIEVGRITGAAAVALIDEELAAQADPARTWEPKRGDLIESAREKGVATDSQWTTYAAHALVLNLIPRTTVRVGDQIPFAIDFECRVGRGNRLALRADCGAPSLGDHAGSLRPNPDPKSPPQSESSFVHRYSNRMMYYFPAGARGSGWAVEPPDVDPLQTYSYVADWPRADHAGTEQLSVDITYQITENALNVVGRSIPPQGPAPSAPPIFKGRVRLTAPVTIVAADTQTVTLVQPDDNARATMAAAIHADPALPGAIGSMLRPPTVERSGPAGLLAHGMIAIDHLPEPVAFDIYWRNGPREWPVGRISADAAQMLQGKGYFRTVADFDADSVDIILRPSPETARRTPYLTRIWGEELVFPNIKVRRGGN